MFKMICKRKDFILAVSFTHCNLSLSRDLKQNNMTLDLKSIKKNKLVCEEVC